MTSQVGHYSGWDVVAMTTNYFPDLFYRNTGVFHNMYVQLVTSSLKLHKA